MSRAGIGYDVHRFVAGRPLVLGGLDIPFAKGLDGHSDADVLLHALMDAVLGAAALGDIGRHFPPGDPAYKGISSLALFRRVRALLADHGWQVVNLDATVIAEAPRLAPYAAAMQAAIAEAAGIPPSAVSIKATTNEGLGFLGRGEGIAAIAVATIDRAAGDSYS